MLKALAKILRTGIITEPYKTEADPAVELVGQACQELLQAKLGGSLAIRHLDAGSCNGCELEIQALNNGFYNLERFNIHFVASPRHADLLLVTGPVARHMEHALRATFAAMPEPKLVLVAGSCAIDGGEFKGSYATIDQVAQLVPVAGIVHGCPPTPLNLLQGILAVLERVNLK